MLTKNCMFSKTVCQKLYACQKKIACLSRIIALADSLFSLLLFSAFTHTYIYTRTSLYHSHTHTYKCTPPLTVLCKRKLDTKNCKPVTNTMKFLSYTMASNILWQNLLW